MGLRAGDTYRGVLNTYVAGGASGAPDSGSLAISFVRHNGANDATFLAALSITTVQAGLYEVSGVIPVGYAGGDTFYVELYYTMNGGATQIYVSLPTVIVDRLPSFPKNTTLPGFAVFVPLSGTSGQTPGTLGATVTAQRRLDGGAIVTCAGTVTSIDGNGYANFVPQPADTNCETGVWIFSAAGCDTQRVYFATSP
jgi:hypothetical protein